MRLPKISTRLIAVVLVFGLLSCGIVFSSVGAGASSYQSQINELEEKQQVLKDKINALQSDIDEQEELKSALQEQIDTVQHQIDIYNAQIEETKDRIASLEEQKGKLEDELAQSKDTFLARIRAMYMSGNNSPLTVLLGADDFADYLYQNELLASVTEYDNEVMAELRKKIEKVDKLEAEVQTEQEEIRSLKAVVDEKRAKLGDNMKALNAVIGELEGQQYELQLDIDDYQSRIDELEEKIQAATRPNNSTSSSIVYDGSQFSWPTPGFYYLSSGFGPRWGRNHNGIDIAGSNIYGTPIVAAADGVVSLVDYNGGGYGYYVMVNHGNSNGNNFTTLYAHMSSQAAYVGQQVSAGDVIGYVGSTGYSTGPHCHFEIRVNGAPQDPMNYFS